MEDEESHVWKGALTYFNFILIDEKNISIIIQMTSWG